MTLSPCPSADFLQNTRRNIPYAKISGSQPVQMAGDQPTAVAALSAGVENGLTEQTLLGVTGSGKTFTMANIIERTQRPTLVLAHNKTLARSFVPSCASFSRTMR